MRIKFSIILLPLLLCVLIPVIIADSDIQENKSSATNSVKKIAFVSKRDGNCEIYTINDDGTDIKRLTNSKDDDLKPQWSPDGAKILYLSKNRKKYAIRVMNSDGTNQIKLANDCVIDSPPLWSPDGAKILFVAKSKSKNGICTVDADGGNLTRLTELDTAGSYPSWSPDGSKILFLEKYRRDTFIYVMKPDGTDRLKITRDKETYQAPTWSPDGRKIAYISTKQKLTGTYNQIYVMNSDGSNNIEIAIGSKKVENIDYNDDMYWSPDGTTIAFTKVAEIEASMSEKGSITYTYIYGTYLVSASGNDHDRMLAKTGMERMPPDWSSDSSKIALMTNSRLLIYNMKTKIDDEIKVNVSIPLSSVKWSPDGKKLVFAGKNHSLQKSSLYLVSLDGTVVLLSEANDYDPVWAPVGE